VTIVVPGRGYVSDEHEVVEFRDMMVIIRDRVRALIGWTPDMFGEAVYRSLGGR
jgi:hypothetical protein